MATPSKARISISRPSYGDGREAMSISVIDDDSRIVIVELEISLSDLMRCLTGRSETEAIVTRFPPESVRGNFGKKKVTKSMYCEKVFGKDEQRKIVLDHARSHAEGWEVWQDGTSSRQDEKQHKYIVMKYED